MRCSPRSLILNRYLNDAPALVEQQREYRSNINQKKITRRMAVNSVFASSKKYNYQLFIGGDSKTPIGSFQMTLREARNKNKEYEDRFFRITDDSYRLRTLRLTEESKEAMKKDIENKMHELLGSRRENKLQITNN